MAEINENQNQNQNQQQENQQQNQQQENQNQQQQNQNQQNKEGGLSAEFDKFLAGEGMQAEFDRRISKALETQKGKLTATIQQQIEAAVTEAQKLANMTKEQRAEHDRQKREDDLAKREAEITRRELLATARDTLTSKGLPVGLAELVNCESADTANASIAAIEKAFQSAVQTAVDAKLKGGKAPDKANNKGGDDLAAQIHNAIRRGFSA